MQRNTESGAILVPKPAAGQIAQVDIEAGQVYLLGFNPDIATFEKQNEDEVRLAFDDGAVLCLCDLFSVVSRGQDFILELSDGTQISGQDLAETFNLVLQDFHTNFFFDQDAMSSLDNLDLFGENQEVLPMPGMYNYETAILYQSHVGLIDEGDSYVVEALSSPVPDLILSGIHEAASLNGFPERGIPNSGSCPEHDSFVPPKMAHSGLTAREEQTLLPDVLSDMQESEFPSGMESILGWQDQLDSGRNGIYGLEESYDNQSNVFFWHSPSGYSVEPGLLLALMRLGEE